MVCDEAVFKHKRTNASIRPMDTTSLQHCQAQLVICPGCDIIDRNWKGQTTSMSFQQPELLQPEEPPLSRARRRRQSRRIVPQGKNSRVQFLDQLTHQATPSLLFFALSILAAIMAGIALLTDAPAFFVLTVIIAPFLAPVVGLALGTLVGSWHFFIQSFVSLLIGLLMFFGGGVIAGWWADGTQPGNYVMAHQLAFVSVADLLLLTFGSVLIIYRLAKVPAQKPHLISAAVAYELLLPAAVAGFGLTSQIPGLFTSALITLLLHVCWTVLLGAVTLAVLGLRPNGTLGYALTGGLVVLCLVGAVLINGSIELPQMPPLEAAALPTLRPTSSEPTATRTPSPTSTPDAALAMTLTAEAIPTGIPATATMTPITPTATATKAIPSATPTITFTPQITVTPMYAVVYAETGGGSIVRQGPYFSALPLEPPYTTLLNNSRVKVYESVINENGTWVRITPLWDESVEGWMLRIYLIFD
jgi:hypothetical protein